MKFEKISANEIVEVKNTRQSRNTVNQDCQDLLTHLSGCVEGDIVALARDTDLFPVTFEAVPQSPGNVYYPDGDKQIVLPLGQARSKMNQKYTAALAQLLSRVNDTRDSLRKEAYPESCDTLHLILQGRADGKTPYAKDGISRVAKIEREYIVNTSEEGTQLSAALIASHDDDPDLVYKRVTKRTVKPFAFDELAHLLPIPEDEEDPETQPIPVVKPQAKRR